jgi:hypothetical protein
MAGDRAPQSLRPVLVHAKVVDCGIWGAGSRRFLIGSVSDDASFRDGMSACSGCTGMNEARIP